MRARAHRWYMLALLTLVYAFNFIDRNIVTILAPDLKADLRLSDAQVGLLFGTAFALFYALFGLPLARLADSWHRVRLLSLGLAFWSALTALSGTATSFAQLALARVGIGIGEASASPAAYSMLQDVFPKHRRATAIAIYMSGIYLGAGASLMIGGGIVSAWNEAYAGGQAPFGLAGWQAAYLAVGLPGLLLALLVVTTVREPVRGALDGTPHRGDPHPFRAAGAELATLFPPASLVMLRRAGASLAAMRANLLALAGCIIGAAGLIAATDALLEPGRRAAIGAIGPVAITTNLVQWCAIAVGAYATFSWVQAIRLRDPAAARLIIGSSSFVALAVGGGVLSLASYGLSAFLFIYGRTYLGLEPADGWRLGAIAAIAGGSGTAVGGFVGDALRKKFLAGRLYVALAAAGLSAAFSVIQYSTISVATFYVCYFAGTFCLTMWLGPVAATCQDHVPARMRGTATAVQFLAINLIGLGLGPYLVGLLSDVTGDLRTAMLGIILFVAPAMALFAYAATRLPRAEAALAAAARQD